MSQPVVSYQFQQQTRVEGRMRAYLTPLVLLGLIGYDVRLNEVPAVQEGLEDSHEDFFLDL